jgi:DNA-binding SARP family transcriptional activator/tetratricopeptide (TPR) repeat protein
VPELEIRLLGPVAAIVGGAPVRLGGVKQRATLAMLALAPRQVVPAERLIDAVWGEVPPATAATALQGHVSRLRRLLGQDAITTRAPGYVLEIDPTAVDVIRFEGLLLAPDDEQDDARSDRLTAALGQWRGPALADILEEPGLIAEARRLEESKLVAREELIDVELRLGRHVELVTHLEELVANEPLRERPTAQLVIALYRSGRPGDALATYRAYRMRLREGLGLDPSPALRDLERRVLVQDPSLAPPAALPGATISLRVPVTAVAVSLQGPPGDAEVYGRAIAAARETTRLTLERHGASVQPSSGTMVVGLFGAPVPQDDDAARALRAADEVCAALAAVADVTARVGVASGEAFAGETPAAAAALELGGEANGAPAVDGLTHARARGRQLRVGTPLAGRAQEQRTLRTLLDATVREGRSNVVSLVGPPGIGKSRLVAELLAGVDPETRVILVRCISYGDGVALLPAIDLVRGAAELPITASATLASTRIGALLMSDDRREAAAEQLIRLLGLSDEAPEDDAMWAVRRLLVALASQTPVVVVIDDLHWAAPAIVDLVRQLDRPAYAPLLVVTTSRLPAPGTTVDLAPLDEAACAELVAGLLDGAEIDPEALADIVLASDGNPLFLEELTLSLRDSRSTTPPTLESLLAARLARLSETDRDVIGAASVIGRSLSVAALRDLVGPVQDTVARAVDDGLLQASRAEGEDLEFRHVLLRDAAYASLPLGRRAELHAKHADWLDRNSQIPPLEREALGVYHLDQALRAQETLGARDAELTETVLARIGQLGRQLLARGDSAAAASLLDRALALAPDDENLAVDLGRAHLDIGDFPAAERAFERSGGPRARFGLVDVRLRTETGANLAAAAVEIAAARSQLEPDDDIGLTEALLAEAYLDVARGHANPLAEHLDAALEVTRRTGQTRAESWILFLVCGAAWYGPLPIKEAVARCEEVLADAVGRPTVEAAALQSLGVLAAMAGKFAEGRRSVVESRAIRRDVGQLVGAAASAIDEGTVEMLAGDKRAAARILREGAEALEELGEKGYYSTVAAYQAQSLLALGEYDEAHRLALVTAGVAAPDDIVSQVTWRCVVARLLTRSDTVAAEALARQAVALAEGTDFILVRSDAWTMFADVTGDESHRETARAVLAKKGCAPAAIDAWTAPLAVK